MREIEILYQSTELAPQLPLPPLVHNEAPLHPLRLQSSLQAIVRKQTLKRDMRQRVSQARRPWQVCRRKAWQPNKEQRIIQDSSQEHKSQKRLPEDLGHRPNCQAAIPMGSQRSIKVQVRQTPLRRRQSLLRCVQLAEANHCNRLGFRSMR
jgi:hypothetical protein